MVAWMNLRDVGFPGFHLPVDARPFIRQGPLAIDPSIITDTPPVAALTAPNSGPKTLSGTHTYIVGRGPAYVVDPGPGMPSHHRAIVAWLDDQSIVPAAILLSHTHPDHAPGARALAEDLQVPICASPLIEADERASLGITQTYGQDEVFPIDGDELRVIPSPGHTVDHVAFWLPGARILFSGDTVLGEGTTLVAPPEGNMTSYMRTLAMFQALDPRLIAPGHGPLVTDPNAKLADYVWHRQQRERQVLEALQDGPVTVVELVDRIYTDVDLALRDLAAGSVTAQLEKLKDEGLVTQAGDRFQVPARASR
jgi:glyoxylase-like metal-dependent hydrolase (beta-lactamase superfamily II)